MTESRLRDVFKGGIKAVRMARSPLGDFRGFATIVYNDALGVEAALSLNGTNIDGRYVRVDLDGKRSIIGFQ